VPAGAGTVKGKGDSSAAWPINVGNMKKIQSLLTTKN
jgi:hypothetical protein